MDAEEYERRQGLTFRQAEGLDALPSQLRLREVSRRFRSLLYAHCHYDIVVDEWEHTVSGDLVRAIRSYWVNVDCEPVNEFPGHVTTFEAYLKRLCFSTDDADTLQLLQFLLQRLPDVSSLRQSLLNLPEVCLLAYRPQSIGNGPIVLMPVASKDSALASAKNATTIATSTAEGSKTHLAAAINSLSNGKWADSARESISIVEAIARHLAKAPKADLGQALKVIETNGQKIHPALKGAILKLYGYTSDEQGIRHSLVDDAAANVDENLALFLFSSCVALGAFLLTSHKE